MPGYTVHCHCRKTPVVQNKSFKEAYKAAVAHQAKRGNGTHHTWIAVGKRCFVVVNRQELIYS